MGQSSGDNKGQRLPLGSRKDARAAIEARNKLVSLFAEVMDEVAPKDTIVAQWDAERQPRARISPLPRESESGQIWPWHTAQNAPLVPNVGYEALGTESGSEPVLVISAFGRSEADLETVVHQVSALQPSFGAFRPLFLVDRADHGILRRMGFTYEVLPPEIYGPLDAQEAFRARFHYLWTKWNGSYLIDFSAQGFLEARIPDFQVYVDPAAAEPRTEGAFRQENQQVALPPDRFELRAKYTLDGLDRVTDTFVLYRILGNDLPPRHRKGQTEENLRFLLDHEPDLEGCEKRWLLNRITDPEQEARLIALLDAHGQTYDRIPFDLAEYGETTDWDVESFPEPAFFLRGLYGRLTAAEKERAQGYARRHKNRYAINNNGARNFALAQGRTQAKWILPWDGNCFLTLSAWEDIRTAVLEAPYFKYFVVPMARITDNAHLLATEFVPAALEEPQILFRCDARESFDAMIHYGRRPKVDLLFRLGVEGPWSTWSRDDIWDAPRPEISPEAGTVGTAGWVARLYSGKAAFEKPGTARERGAARSEGVTAMLDRLDEAYLSTRYDSTKLLSYDEAKVAGLAEAAPGSPEHVTFDCLVRDADLALQRGPWSVLQKTCVPPSGDPRHYCSPAPYWWPNADASDGLPFTFRDGEQNPAAILYSRESDRFDRSRLQRMLDDTTILALAWRATGEAAYARHAAKLVRTWFVDHETGMSPHLRFARVKSHRDGEEGSRTGIIEMKDLYFFLDAIRLLERARVFGESDSALFADWLTRYMNWLRTSPQGIEEHLASNNHGTCYDLQVLAIAAYLGDLDQIRNTLRTSRERVLEQFKPSGEQPNEMQRSMTAHCCAFNLQCWVNLADMAAALGDRLWAFHASDGRSLAAGLGWLFNTVSAGPWPYDQVEPFDQERFRPLLDAAHRVGGCDRPSPSVQASLRRALYFPDDGIKPYWMLGTDPDLPGANALWEGWRDQIGDAERKLDTSPNKIFPVPALAPFALEERARCGFPDQAITLLRQRLIESVGDGSACPDAARALARTSFQRGEWSDARSYISLVPAGQSGNVSERALVQAHCLAREGRRAEADSLREAELQAHPDDVDVLLSAVDTSGGTFGSERSIDLLNTMFRGQGLGEAGRVLTEDGPVFDLRQRTAPWARSDQRPSRQWEIETSIVLLVPVGEEERLLRRTLTSLSFQSLVPDEVILLGPSVGMDLHSVSTRLIDRGTSLKRIEGVPGRPTQFALKEGLEVSSSSMICVALPGEIWHPDHLSQAIARLAGEACRAVVPRAVTMDADGLPEPHWQSSFGYASAYWRGALLTRASIEEFGGWDDVPDNPVPFLLHRIKDAFGDAAVRKLPGTVPTIWTARSSERALDPFAYGKRRDVLRQMEHLFSRARRSAPLGADAPPRPSACAPIAASRPFAKEHGSTRFTRVYVGDFSNSGLMVSGIVDAILGELKASGPQDTFGMFHWPSFPNALAPLQDDIADQIADGTLYQISPFETGTGADTLTLCTPYVVWRPVAGLPDFRPDRLEVLLGTALSAQEWFIVDEGPLPNAGVLERIFGKTPEWRNLDNAFAGAADHPG